MAKKKYEDYVKPYLNEIREWCSNGATEKEICKALGIGTTSFNEYKKIHPELMDALKEGRQHIIFDIKAALIKKALGYDYEESKTIEKVTSSDITTTTEKVVKHSSPDTTAAAMMLRNLDDDWHDRDSQTNEIKEREIKIKEDAAEQNNFDI